LQHTLAVLTNVSSKMRRTLEENRMKRCSNAVHSNKRLGTVETDKTPISKVCSNKYEWKFRINHSVRDRFYNRIWKKPTNIKLNILFNLLFSVSVFFLMEHKILKNIPLMNCHKLPSTWRKLIIKNLICI